MWRGSYRWSHVVRGVGQLAKRDYPSKMLDAMEFVVCYLPGEELVATAYEARPTLFWCTWMYETTNETDPQPPIWRKPC